MRQNSLLVFLMALLFAFASCEGEIGPQGPAGQDGVDGVDGVNGQDGADGADGQDGADGANGADGNDGADGQDGVDGEDGLPGFLSITGQDRSRVPGSILSIAPEFSATVETFSVMSSIDSLVQTPDFIMAGNPDGAGLLDNGNGTFDWICNAENHWAVMAITFSATLQPLAGRYIANGDGVNNTRLCSGTLVTPEEHGFGPTFLTAGESGSNSLSYQVDPLSTALNQNVTALTSIGQWSAENVVPLTQDAYPGQTVVLTGDDDSGAPGGGQIAIYIANGVGNLDAGTNGFVGVLRPAGATAFMAETDVQLGDAPLAIEFVEIPNATNLTGDDIDQMSANLFAFAFGRVEDLDYRRGGGANAREIYFNVTGQSGNADRTQAGRVYRLILSETDPTQGTLEVVIDGDAQPELQIQSPDNITVTENFVYVTEDPNNIPEILFHDARIYQFEIATGITRIFAELNHFRGAAEGDFFGSNNPNNANDRRFGAWEYGAMVDVTDVMGLTNSQCFLLNLQIHSWDESATGFTTEGVAGGTSGEDEAGVIVAIKGNNLR